MDRSSRNLKGVVQQSTDAAGEHSADSQTKSTVALESGEQEADMGEVGLPPQLPKEPCFASEPPTSYTMKKRLKWMAAGIAAAVALLKGTGFIGMTSPPAPVAGRNGTGPDPAQASRIPESTVPPMAKELGEPTP